MIACYTPTAYYGALDVTYASLKKQTYKDFVWLIADEKYEQRKDIVADQVKELDYLHVDSSKWRKEGYERTLATAGNWAINKSRELGAEIMVSLQDYIWLADDALERVKYICDMHNDILYTGITHISEDPEADKAINKEGLWTVFEEPYDGHKPERIHWHDVRQDNSGDLRYVEAVWWEMNFAAIANVPLYDYMLEFDETYDFGVAYENQAYAFDGVRLGYPTVLDEQNIAISLPHKKYYPELEAADMKRLNIYKHHKKYGLPLPG